jgi:hypothetical protein
MLRNKTIFEDDFQRLTDHTYIKHNCDRTYKDSSGLAGCGVLFRNSDGRWITGYSQKIGTCDALCDEMWGMYLGM